MKCLVCGRRVDELRTAIKGGVYLSERCDRCINQVPTSAVYARKFERDRQREDYRRDLIQPLDGDKMNKDFIRQYPDKAQEYWGRDVLKEV